MLSILIVSLPIASTVAILVFVYKRRARHQRYMERLRGRICDLDSV